MTAPNTTASADGSSAPTFAEEIGEFFGDFTTPAETPDPDPTSAAGTTPVEPATGPASEPTSETGVAGTDAGEAREPGTTPAPVAAAAEDDPFKDTTPATFTVNGKPVTNEDIRVFKEGGAVIRPDALPNVLNRLSERESLFERNRAQSIEYQTLAKVSEWHDHASGKTYTGPEAAIELRIGNAALYAENKLLVDTLTDPARLFAILTTEQIPDGKGGVTERVILNPTALRDIQRENALQQRELSAAIRDHYKTVIAESAKGQPEPVNFAAEAPRLVAAIATASQLDPNTLTAEDRQILAEQLPFHTKDGLASVAWQNLAKRIMTDRAQQKAASQSLVTTTERATKEGQARMAAAARGVRPAVQPVTPTRTVSPDTTRAQNEGDLYDMTERAAAQAMRQRA